MPPKTSAPAEGDAAATEPRRSGRIASQPTTAPAPAPPKRKASGKKRAAEGGEEEEGGSVKKAKASEQGEAAPAPAYPELALGDSLSALKDLVLKNEKGEEVKVAELAAEKGVVLFLVPKADTPGCTNQACGFRDSYPDFTSHNFVVYCLSADAPTAQAKWQTKKSLPYPLLSDPTRALISALGAGAGGKTKRSHFIFEKGGKLVERRVPVSPADSPKLALEFVKTHSTTTTQTQTQTQTEEQPEQTEQPPPQTGPVEA